MSYTATPTAQPSAAPQAMQEVALDQDSDKYVPIWELIGRAVPLRCKQEIVDQLWRQHRINHYRACVDKPLQRKACPLYPHAPPKHTHPLEVCMW